MEEKVPLDISRKYSGLAYGSCRVYRFSVCENTLNAEILEEGLWKKEEELSDFQWDGKCSSPKSGRVHFPFADHIQGAQQGIPHGLW